jgi:UDP-GlcNAc:undecaprenyl-phosphate GlcNAc-1-phosphate transferase
LDFINNSLPINYNIIKIIGIFVVCTIAFIMGLADDAYNTQPLLKFSTQLVCGFTLYFTGTNINTFDCEYINFALTVLWVVGIMNSINMLDNMDGITTTVSIIILLFVIILNVNLNTMLTPLPILSLGILGTLLGFLVYNWHPAKMFMGDTGSQFLGSFLAVIGIDDCFNASHVITMSDASPVFIGLVVLALVFILPLTDTLTVTINRIKKGKSPFIGGKDHTTHHLFFRGFSPKQVVILFVAIGIVGMLLALTLLFRYQTLWLIIAIVFCVATFVSLYLNTIIKHKK